MSASYFGSESSARGARLRAAQHETRRVEVRDSPTWKNSYALFVSLAVDFSLSLSLTLTLIKRGESHNIPLSAISAVSPQPFENDEVAWLHTTTGAALPMKKSEEGRVVPSPCGEESRPWRGISPRMLAFKARCRVQDLRRPVLHHARGHRGMRDGRCRRERGRRGLHREGHAAEQAAARGPLR